MGEWSDYFEDFPEENPANQVPPLSPLQEAQKAAQLKGNSTAAEVQDLLRKALKDHPPKR